MQRKKSIQKTQASPARWFSGLAVRTIKRLQRLLGRCLPRTAGPVADRYGDSYIRALRDRCCGRINPASALGQGLQHLAAFREAS